MTLSPQTPIAPPSVLKKLWRFPIFQLIVYILLIWLGVRFLTEVKGIVIDVIVAYLLAHLANPVLGRLEQYKIKRPWGIVLLGLLLFGMLAAITPLIGTIAKELQTLTEHLPDLLSNLNTQFKQLAQRSPLLHDAQQQFDQWVSQNAKTFPQKLSEIATSILSPKGALVSGVLGAVGLISQLFITIIISIYMMAIYPSIKPFLIHLLPERYQALGLEITGHVSHAVGGYFRGQITVALILGVLIAAGLTVLGIPSGLAIGFLAAIFNIVPYLGVVLSLIPALLLAISFGGLKVALVAGLFLLINQLEGHVIAPKVVSDSTNLSALAVLLSILMGVEVFGLMGALIAVPLVALIKSLMVAYYYPSRPYRALSEEQALKITSSIKQENKNEES